MNTNSGNGLDSSVALRFDKGISYGAVVWIKGTELQIQSSARLQKGDVVEFRMELIGREEAPYGLLLVLESLSGGLESASSLRAAFLSIEDRDLEVLNAWIADREALHYTGSTAARLDRSDTAHQALHAPQAASARQRYQQNKGRLDSNPDILRGPFDSSARTPQAEDSFSTPSVSTDPVDFPPPMSSQTNQASAYLRSMSKRRKARENAPHQAPRSAPRNEDWELPPPPPAALKKPDTSSSEDWELPPPPPAALKKPDTSSSEDWELPPPPPAALKKASNFEDLEISLESGTLTVNWSTLEAYQKAVATLRQGSLLIPKQTTPVERLALVLPNQQHLALRVKGFEHIENTTKVNFRINPVLSSKLDAALE